jgi:hypothetical protein
MAYSSPNITEASTDASTPLSMPIPLASRALSAMACTWHDAQVAAWCRQMRQNAALVPSSTGLPLSSTAPTPVHGSALRQPGFVPFLAARMLGLFAQQMQAVVVAWQVYDITRDPLSLAYVGLAQFLPMLLLLVPAGDLSDRMSRKRILASAGRGRLVRRPAAVADHAGRTWGGRHLRRAGAVWLQPRLHRPGLQSLLPQIVPREHLAQALATNSMLMRTSAIAAPCWAACCMAWVAAC